MNLMPAVDRLREHRRLARQTKRRIDGELKECAVIRDNKGNRMYLGDSETDELAELAKDNPNVTPYYARKILEGCRKAKSDTTSYQFQGGLEFGLTIAIELFELIMAEQRRVS